MKQTSIHRIYIKLNRDLGLNDIPEMSVIEWAGEALEAIGAVPAYEEVVGFFEVSNHQIQLHSNLHAIIQIAKNNVWTEDDKKCFCPSDIVDSANICTVEIESEDSETTSLITVDPCGECTECGTLSEYVPNFNATYEFGVWSGSNLYTNYYSPVRLSDHTFIGSLVCDEDPNIYDYVQDEYTVVNGDTVRFSFETGSVAIAYYRQKTDENGYPMIPDHFTYIKAITAYVTMMLMKYDYFKGRQGSKDRYETAKFEWNRACRQAGNYAYMPKTIDKHQNLLDRTQHFFPKLRRYYGFFGKLSNPEYRKYNKPSRRHYGIRYIE